MFQQQRFGFRMSYGHVYLLDLRHQSFSFAGGQIISEIAGKTLFQVFRFAYIDNRAARVIHPIDARLAGHGFQERF
ncbi:hypothetical protein D3C87_2060800 [compost metagenome]